MIYPVLGGGRYYNPNPTNLAEKVIESSRHAEEMATKGYDSKPTLNAEVNMMHLAYRGQYAKNKIQNQQQEKTTEKEQNAEVTKKQETKATFVWPPF